MLFLTRRLLLMLVAVLAAASWAYAQTDGAVPTDLLQRRIDSLRRTVTVQQDQAQVYHDSVLQALRQRSQRGNAMQQRIDSLRRTVAVRQDQAQRYHDSVLYALRQRTTEATQGRIDSLRQTVAVRQNQAQAYHDSVLQYLQARSGEVSSLLPGTDAEALTPTVSLPSSLNPRLPSLPSQPALPTVPSLPSAEQLTAQSIDPLRSASESAQQYIRSASEPVQAGQQVAPNAPAALEQQVGQRSEVQALIQQETALKTQLKEQTPEVIAEQMKQQVAQGVKQPLANHTEAISEGEAQLAQLKRKYRQVQTEQERYEKAVSLKKEAWAARLLLGTYFQVYGATTRREPGVSADISPFMGYRFNTRWSVGVGASYRAAFRRVRSSEPLYQARAFAESVVYRGFLLHAAYERSWQPQPGDQGQSIVDAYAPLVGIGKTYRITRKLRGTTLLLFRLASDPPPLNLPRWNLRTGVYLSQ